MINLLCAERDGFKSRAGFQRTQFPAVTSFCEAFFNTAHDLIAVEATLLEPRADKRHCSLPIRRFADSPVRHHVRPGDMNKS